MGLNNRIVTVAGRQPRFRRAMPAASADSEIWFARSDLIVANLALPGESAQC